MIELAPLKELIKKQKEILLAYIFGSIIKGKELPKSDVDIALLIEKERFEKGEHKNEIEYALLFERSTQGKTVDARILNQSPLYFQYEVLKTGKVLFCRDPLQMVRYESAIMDQYFDYKPQLDYYNKCMYKHIKEGYLGYRR